MLPQLFVAILALSCGSAVAQSSKCVQGGNCHLPDCFCPTFQHPDFPDVKDIPQMVYFGFDDALHVQVDQYYKQLFTKSRKNPNGCPISMSLYVQDQWTSYALVNAYYKRGDEIASHSVTHTNVDTEQKLLFEAGRQKYNLTHVGGVPRDQVVGWRSPNLKTAGDVQPDVLQRLGYSYDISLTYTRHSANDPVPWPYTLDYGYPYSCSVRPCPGFSSSHPGFWEIPVPSLYDPHTRLPCAYVDSCRPDTEAAALDYLWSNFEKVYNGNRAPFGLNMHAAWFFTPSNLQATHAFLDRLLQLKDVYVITAKQVLDWMRNPVKVSEVYKLPEWSCPEAPATRPQSGHRPSGVTHSPIARTARPSSTTTTPPPPLTHRLPARTNRPSSLTRRPQSLTQRPQSFTQRPQSFTQRPQSFTQRPQSFTQRPQSLTQRPPAVMVPQSFIPLSSNSARSGSQQGPVNQGSHPSSSSSGQSPILITFSQHNLGPTHNSNHFNNPPFSVFGPFTPRPSSTTTTTKSPTSPDAAAAVSNTNGVSVVHSLRSGSNAGQSGVVNSSMRGGQGSGQGDVCLQDQTCFLPACQCRSLAPPRGLALESTPQIVYLTFMGNVDGVNYQQVLNLLSSPSRLNPNSCPLTATFFVSANGNYVPYLQSLRSRGNEISMYGTQPYLLSDNLPAELQVSSELAQFQSLVSGTSSAAGGGGVNTGYRSPTSLTLGDTLLKALRSKGVLYDSSLVTSRRLGGTEQSPWPYTLDYGWGECSTNSRDCPSDRHPGLWEVPIVPLVDNKQEFVCTYADACYNSPRTSQDTYNFLIKNLEHNMNTNRAPLGIHLRKDWFSHPYYYPNLRGLEQFLDTILKTRNDVYVTSVEKMLDWMKNPTSLANIKSFEPWKC